MKNAMLATFSAFAVAGAITLSAQTPTQTPSTTRTQPSTTHADDKEMTLTGCLKASDAAAMTAPGTTGTAGAMKPSGATAMAGTFLLTNIEREANTAGAGSTTPAAGTMGTAGGDTKPAHKQYMVTGDSTVNLAAHVNHKVRITGRVDAMAGHSMGTPSATTPAEPSAHAGMGAMDAAATTIKATSVTMISASCTATSK